MLILSGGGDPENVVPIDTFFSEQVDKDRTVLYIPVAMEESCFTYKECYTWFKNTYGQYGITNIRMCIDLKEELSDLSEYAAVFIGGGNTFKLLKIIKESNFDQKLIRYLQNGGLVYGSSADSVSISIAFSDKTQCGKMFFIYLDNLCHSSSSYLKYMISL
jgi:dipeptidase E